MALEQSSAPEKLKINRRIILKIFLYSFLIILAAITLLPIVYTFFDSFKPLGELLSNGAQLIPETWQFENYLQAWNRAEFSRYFTNTVIIAVCIVVFDTIFSSMCGYVLARKNLPGQKLIEGSFAFTIFLGIGTITLYPKLILALKFGMLGLDGIIFVELAGIMVIHIFLIKAFCQSLGSEMYEAASVDGCSFFGTWVKIAFPLMRPILATTSILAFEAAWNNFQIPFIFTLSNPDLRTLAVGIYALKSSGMAASSWNLMMAGTMMALIPVILMFIFLQKYFIRGLTAGSIKG